jgi:hypothetical protein
MAFGNEMITTGSQDTSLFTLKISLENAALNTCPAPPQSSTYFLNLRYINTVVNPILHTAWLNNHALTLKINTAKYYFGDKSSFLHTFLKFCCE